MPIEDDSRVPPRARRDCGAPAALCNRGLRRLGFDGPGLRGLGFQGPGLHSFALGGLRVCGLTLMFAAAAATARTDSPQSPAAGNEPPKSAATRTKPAPARSYSLQDVAGHARREDCWVAIDGQVYDLTGFIPQHAPGPELVVPSCGKDATQAWATKGVGRPHSAYAKELLVKTRIGKLETAPK